MAEQINEKVFDASKKFVDLAGLDYFWDKAKEYIDGVDEGLTGKIGALETSVNGSDESNGLIADVQALQTDLESITTGEDSVYNKIVTAEQNAKDYADEKTSTNKGLIDGLSTKIAALEELSNAANIVYQDNSIYLVDGEGNKIGSGFDASDFIADGMLDSVKFEEVEGVKTNNLEFTFNSASGKQKIIVDFAKYVDTYHADDSSIALDSATNTFSVKKVDASKTTLNTTIQIAGGPLANDVAESDEEWPWHEDGNRVLPAGKTLEEILTTLFLKIVNGTVTWGDASWDPTVDAPTATLSATTLEVGSTVKVSKLAAGNAKGGTRSATCTCTQGYFDADAEGNATGSYNAGDKTISVAGGVEGDAELSCTWNGTDTDITVNSTELSVVEGTNTLVVSQAGQTATCEALPTTKVFGATNTKVLLSDTHATFTDSKPADVALENSASFTMTGKYKYFMGYSSNTVYSQFDSASVRALTTKSDWVTKGGTTTIVSGTAIKSNGKSIVIACPATYKLASINNGVGADIIENFTTKGSYGSVDVTTGKITTPYTVYVYPITNGAVVEFKNVTLTKA